MERVRDIRDGSSAEMGAKKDKLRMILRFQSRRRTLSVKKKKQKTSKLRQKADYGGRLKIEFWIC